MILLDFSNLIYKAVYTTNVDTNSVEDMRAVILSQIMRINNRLKDKYGRMVICIEGRGNWRVNEFSWYKYSRRHSKKESLIDWGEIYGWCNQILDELREWFPYQVLQVDNTEADDLLGVLALNAKEERVCVASNDGDCKQLLAHPLVDLYNIDKDVFTKCPDPLIWLQEAIIRGQGKDGVPNIYSPSDHFTLEVKPRQKAITQKFLSTALTQSPEVFCENEEVYRRYKENEKLIDLRKVPEDIKQNILDEFNKMNYNKDASKKIYKYFFKHDLTLFSKDISKFI